MIAKDDIRGISAIFAGSKISAPKGAAMKNYGLRARCREIE
jgi:hypothetical protein